MLTQTTTTPIAIEEIPRGTGSFHEFHVHHRDFPERWARGETTAQAVRHLVNHFIRDLDGIPGPELRLQVEEVLNDLYAFLETIDGDPKRPTRSSTV